MLHTAGRMGQQGLLAHRVVRKAAAGQHHAAAGAHFQLALRGMQHRADHAPAFHDEALRRAAGADVHAPLQRRGGQRGHQRIAIDQAHAPAVQQQISPVAQH